MENGSRYPTRLQRTFQTLPRLAKERKIGLVKEQADTLLGRSRKRQNTSNSSLNVANQVKKAEKLPNF
jgi:hypothetical protein